MSAIALRQVIVVADNDVSSALRNDELTDDELEAYLEDGCPVSYTLAVENDIDAILVCAAIGLEAGEENELADSDRIATSWDTDGVGEALDYLRDRLKDPEALATDLAEHVASELDVEDSCDLNELVDILEKLDKGYEPAEDAHPAIAAAGLLVRLVLAFRVASRHDGWVVAF